MFVADYSLLNKNYRRNIHAVLSQLMSCYYSKLLYTLPSIAESDFYFLALTSFTTIKKNILDLIVEQIEKLLTVTFEN